MHCEWAKIDKVIIKKLAKICANIARLAQTFIPHFLLIKALKIKQSQGKKLVHIYGVK